MTLRPPPPRIPRVVLVIIILVLSFILTGAIYYLFFNGSEPIVVGEHGTEAVSETPVSRETSVMPSVADAKKVWASIRTAFLSQDEGVEDAAESGLLDMEAEVSKARGLLNKLVTLDPSKDADEIEGVLTGIRKIGYPAIDPLTEMLKSHRTEKHVLLLLDALAQVTDAQVEKPLETLITSHPSKAVRDKARDLYVDRSEPESRQKFVNESVGTLAAPSPEMSRIEKANRIDFIAASGHPEAFQRLKEISLGDPDIGLRQRAAQAIGGMNTAEGEKFLFGLLLDDPSLRRAAADALGKSKSQTVAENAILLMEESDDKAVKLAAIDVLGKTGSPAAAQYLLKLLKMPQDEELMRAAGAAAGSIATSEMAQSLIDLLGVAQERGQRRAIVAAISKIGVVAVPLLSGAAIKSSGTARADVIRALSQMRNKESFDALKKILEEWRIGGDPEAQNELLVGIKLYGKEDVVPALEKIAAKASVESTRQTAMEAIADIKKGEAMPFILKAYQSEQSASVRRTALNLMRRYGDSDIADVLRQELLYGEEKGLKPEIEKTIEDIDNRESSR